jgi:hypothetical protein
MRINPVAMALVVAVPFAATDAFALTNCQKLYARYQDAPGHKAFATTLGNDPGHHPTSCSFIPGSSLKKRAEEKAVAQCNRIRRPEDGGRCKVINSK